MNAKFGRGTREFIVQPLHFGIQVIQRQTVIRVLARDGRRRGCGSHGCVGHEQPAGRCLN